VGVREGGKKLSERILWTLTLHFDLLYRSRVLLYLIGRPMYRSTWSISSSAASCASNYSSGMGFCRLRAAPGQTKSHRHL